VHGSSGDVTALLRRWCQGDEAAGAELTPLVYSELRRLAKQRPRAASGPTIAGKAGIWFMKLISAL